MSNYRSPADYAITLPSPWNDAVVTARSHLYTRVWRTSLDEPGFALIRFGFTTDSHSLRRLMLALVERLPTQFVPERFGRFDQQVSSRFHRDGAPPASLVLLGYEPTTVESRLFIADSSVVAAEAGLPLPEFLVRNNPMFPTGEAKYLPYVTEINLPRGEPVVVAINNSNLPISEVVLNPLGVLHKALIDKPDPGAKRIINSVGFTLPGLAVPKTGSDLEHFLSRIDLD
jgi:hypothetical protein